MVLTPASSHTSCEGGCSQSDDHDDFDGLMDENGIIGLLEALEIVGVGEYSDDGESGHNVPSGLPASVETETPAEAARILTQSPGRILPYFTLIVSGQVEWTYLIASLLSTGLNSEAEMTGDKKNKGVMRRTDRKQNRSKRTNPSGMLTEATGVAKERSMGSDVETFLDLSFTEGLEGTHGGLSNLRLGPCFQPSAMFAEETMSGVANTLVNGSRFSDGNRQPPSPSSRMMKEGCPDAARSSASFTAEAFKNTSSRADRNPTASSKSAMLKKPR